MIKEIYFTVGLLAISLSACSTGPNDDAAEIAKDLVNHAVDLIEDKNEAAFEELNGRDWRQGEPYVFVLGFGGVVWVHPAQPELIGTSQINMKDAIGTFIVKEFIKELKNKDSTWIEYRWIEPENKKACNKRSYIKKALTSGGAPYIVGSGYCKETFS